MTLFLIIATSYIIGSLPYGLILVKVFKGVDIRTIGSKNIGTTNVLRAGYPVLALFTLLLDVFKGLIAIVVSNYIYIYSSADLSFLNISFMSEESIIISFSALFAVLGHIYTPWLKFKGGKGVATFFGILIFLNIKVAIMAPLIWLLTALITKYSSLSAIVSILSAPVLMYFFNINYFAVILVLATVIILKHHQNIARLISGTETKINFKKKNAK